MPKMTHENRPALQLYLTREIDYLQSVLTVNNIFPEMKRFKQPQTLLEIAACQVPTLAKEHMKNPMLSFALRIGQIAVADENTLARHMTCTTNCLRIIDHVRELAIFILKILTIGIPEFGFVMAGHSATELALIKRLGKNVINTYDLFLERTYLCPRIFTMIPLENCNRWHKVLKRRIADTLGGFMFLEVTLSSGMGANMGVIEINHSVYRLTITKIQTLNDYRPILDGAIFNPKFQTNFNSNYMRFDNSGNIDFRHRGSLIGRAPIVSATSKEYQQIVCNPIELGTRVVEIFVSEASRCFIFVNGTGNCTSLFLGQESREATDEFMKFDSKLMESCCEIHTTLSPLTPLSRREIQWAEEKLELPNRFTKRDYFSQNFGNGIEQWPNEFQFIHSEPRFSTRVDRRYFDHFFDTVYANKSVMSLFRDCEDYKHISDPKNLPFLLPKLRENYE